MILVFYHVLVKIPNIALTLLLTQKTKYLLTKPQFVAYHFTILYTDYTMLERKHFTLKITATHCIL